MTDLTDLSLLEAGAALRAGEVASLELTRACLERIASLDPSLHAFLAVAPAPAEAQAAAGDPRLAEARRAGGPPPPRPFWAFRSSSRTCCASKVSRRRPAPASSRDFVHRSPPPPFSGCSTPASSCWARPTPTRCA